MSEKIGSLVIDIEGTELSALDREIIAHPLVGGLILFARNDAPRAELTALCQSIRAVRKTPILLMVDQEGGRVQRFINEFTRLPSLQRWGQLYDKNPVLACAMVKECGWLMASELLSVGIDLSFAPVLDLNKGFNLAIDDRTFHSKPDAVTALAACYMTGMREAGMEATGKHFPGHGAVSGDSHVTVPVDNRPYRDIAEVDMQPFANIIMAGISSIMAAHIIFPAIDTLPVGFSRVWLQDILRKRLNFKGVIFSDDLNMEGANISSNYADRVQAAKEAGCDFTLLCNNRKGVIQVLDTFAADQFQLEPDVWQAMRGSLNGVNYQYTEDPRYLAIQKFMKTTLNELITEQDPITC